MRGMAVRFTTRRLLLGMVGVAVSFAAWASIPPLKNIYLQHVPICLLALIGPWVTAGVILGNTEAGLLAGIVFAIVVALFAPAVQG